VGRTHLRGLRIYLGIFSESDYEREGDRGSGDGTVGQVGLWTGEWDTYSLNILMQVIKHIFL